MRHTEEPELSRAGGTWVMEGEHQPVQNKPASMRLTAGYSCATYTRNQAKTNR
jgi:hypothetical protein